MPLHGRMHASHAVVDTVLLNLIRDSKIHARDPDPDILIYLEVLFKKVYINMSGSGS